MKLFQLKISILRIACPECYSPEAGEPTFENLYGLSAFGVPIVKKNTVARSPGKLF